MSDEHQRYIAHLRSQIRPGAVAQVSRARAIKRNKKTAKHITAVAGFGLGGLLLAAFFRKPGGK